MNCKHFPLIPIMANGIFWEGNEGNMEEIGGCTQSWENPRRKQGCLMLFVFFVRALPRGEIILEVLEMPGTPEKQKGAAATITKQIQKLAKKNNQWQPKILLFPLIPTKAKTTKLAQKLEKHPKPSKTIQNQLKPCSTSGLLRGNLFKDTILTLLDPIWLCWKLLKFVPQLCKKGNRFRPFANSCLRSLAIG